MSNNILPVTAELIAEATLDGIRNKVLIDDRRRNGRSHLVVTKRTDGWYTRRGKLRYARILSPLLENSHKPGIHRTLAFGHSDQALSDMNAFISEQRDRMREEINHGKRT